MRRAIVAATAAFTLALVSCSQKQSPETAAKTFFDQLAAGKTQQAYDSGTFAFKAQQSLKYFESALKELGITTIKDVAYHAPELEDGGQTAKVRADLTTGSGATVPLVVTLTKESGSWKVFALKSPRSLETGLIDNPFSTVGRGPDFVEPVQRQPAPDEAAARALVLGTLLEFNDAVRAADFLEFFEACSLSWQDQLVTGQVTPGIPKAMRVPLTETQKEIGASRLKRAFQPFIDKQVNLTGIEKVEAAFDQPPRVTTDGLLVVSGSYPTEPYRVVFSMKFTYEVPKWKLFGLDVSLRK